MDRSEVEYQIAGLDQELREGLVRLERANAAPNVVALYRKWFDDDIRQLRSELDSPEPDIHAIAYHAMQASWIARIWPILQSARLQWRGPDNLKDKNAKKKDSAADKQQRCLVIARTLTRPTPPAIQRRYAVQFPGEPIPSATTIRRYLNAPQQIVRHTSAVWPIPPCLDSQHGKKQNHSRKRAG